MNCFSSMTLRLCDLALAVSVVLGGWRVVAWVWGFISTRHSAPLSTSVVGQSASVVTTRIYDVPLGRNPLTLTTTLTLPPPLSGVLLPIGTTSESLDRSDGVDAEDLSDRTSVATPGKPLGSNAISWKATATVWINSLNLDCCRLCIHGCAHCLLQSTNDRRKVHGKAPSRIGDSLGASHPKSALQKISVGRPLKPLFANVLCQIY